MRMIFKSILLAAAFWTGTIAQSFADELLSTGTAFAVTDDGWFLTNAHVVRNCTRVEIRGVGFAEPPRLDETNDLAAIRVTSGKPVRAIGFRKDPVRLGEDIVALGFPLNGLLSESIKVTTGNVNALAGIANDTRYIQISTPIQPGNSGGPIVDKDGLLVGVTTATLSKSVADKIDITAQNVNFAIRSPVAEVFLQSHGIGYRQRERQAESKPLSTADLAERIAPSVFPVACYGEPAGRARIATPDDGASAGHVSLPQPALIDATGYDSIGFDYQTIRDVSYAACKSACESDRQCQAFTYNVHHGVCFLKNDVVAMIRNSDAASGYSSAKAGQVVFSNFTVYRDMDFPGGDYLRLSNATYESCLLACIQDQACRGFAYVRKKHDCWLKNRLGTARVMKGVEFGMK